MGGVACRVGLFGVSLLRTPRSTVAVVDIPYSLGAVGRVGTSRRPRSAHPSRVPGHERRDRADCSARRFYYDEYDGDHPSVYLGSRAGRWIRVWLSASDKDYAQYNVVMQNQIFKRSVDDMIRTRNLSVNSPNYKSLNRTVTDETVDWDRPAGCYFGTDAGGFVEHGASFEESLSWCQSIEYSCDDGLLSSELIIACTPEPMPGTPVEAEPAPATSTSYGFSLGGFSISR